MRMAYAFAEVANAGHVDPSMVRAGSASVLMWYSYWEQRQGSDCLRCRQVLETASLVGFGREMVINQMQQTWIACQVCRIWLPISIIRIRQGMPSRAPACNADSRCPVVAPSRSTTSRQMPIQRTPSTDRRGRRSNHNSTNAYAIRIGSSSGHVGSNGGSVGCRPPKRRSAQRLMARATMSFWVCLKTWYTPSDQCQRCFATRSRTVSLMPETALYSSIAARSLPSARRRFSFRDRIVTPACFANFASRPGRFGPPAVHGHRRWRHVGVLQCNTEGAITKAVGGYPWRQQLLSAAR